MSPEVKTTTVLVLPAGGLPEDMGFLVRPEEERSAQTGPT